MRHITHIEADPESLRRGGSCRTAACTCGWRGPQRGTMVLAADDALSHEGVADHKPPAGASPLEVVTGPARRRGAGDAYQGNDAPLTAAEGELLRRASHPAMKFACAAAHGTSRDDPRRQVVRALLGGNPRAAAALLVRATHGAAAVHFFDARLALNHLPTAWVIACRAIEDAIAAGGPHALREAASTGDPEVLRVALLARLGSDHPPQVERHLREAIEAVEREAAGS